MTANSPRSSLVSLRRKLARGVIILPFALGMGLAGCANANRVTTASAAVTTPLTPADFQKAVEYWGQRYDTQPKDKTVALNYAAALRRLNRNDQAVAVLQKAVIARPDDREVLAAYGKALAANGDLDQALEIVRRAQTPDRPDWQLQSAEAAILDEQGQHDGARTLYAQALTTAPNQPTLLSNYGMSYVLTGDLKQAETLLRQAASLPTADARVRQNLALVVGLEGRFAEAEQIATADLSPEDAAANVAYLKSMLSQQNSWQKIKSADSGRKDKSSS